MSDRPLGILCALAASLAWAAGAVLYRDIGRRVSAGGLNLVKSAMGLVLIAVAALALGGTAMDARSVALLSLSGLLGIAVGDTLFFRALDLLGAHLVVILAVFGQALTVLLAVALLGERPGAFEWAGIALVTLGIALALVPRFSSDSTRFSGKGLAFGLGASACMAGATILTKLGIASVPAAQATAVRMGAGVAGMLLFGAACGRLREWGPLFLDRRLLREIFLAVCVATVGGFWLSHLAIKLVDVSIANTLASTEPIFVIPLAAVFLREKIRPTALAGAVLAAAGLAALAQG